MTGTDPWTKHPAGPIATSVAQLGRIPLWMLGQRTPWLDDIDPRGHWRLTVKCEWVGTEAELDEYMTRNERLAA